SSIAEISADRALRLYGLVLALTVTLTGWYWLRGPLPLSDILGPSTPPICWPFWDRCGDFHGFPESTIRSAIWMFTVLGIVDAWLFVTRFVRGAYWILAFLTCVKVAVILLDYRLVLNHHMMTGWVTLVFLFVSRKRIALMTMLCAFYVWAGALKLTPDADWLSGAALHGARPFHLPAALVPVACSYVVLLELVAVWGLLSRSAPVFWLSYAQFLVFHLASFWVVGWFYPLLMFLLLSILVLIRFLPAGHVNPLKQPSKMSRDAVAVLAVFCAAQLVPAVIPGRAAFTGEGRIFALNMFDGPPLDCRAVLVRRSSGAVSETIRLRILYLNARLTCDPIVFRSATLGYCSAEQNPDIDLIVDARKRGAPDYHRLIDVASFCSVRPGYRLLWRNYWIRLPAG